MSCANPGERNFYLHDFGDELQPCEPTLDAWATWLANPDDGSDPAEDGAVFTGSAVVWQDDIIATRAADGTWSLSRDPSDDQLVAVRFGEGLGWTADNIILPSLGLIDGSFRVTETVAASLLAWLTANTKRCEDREYVACADTENGWRFTYHANPPRLDAQRGH